MRLAYLFGSAADAPAHSQDIDIAVLPDEGFSYRALYADLSLLLHTDRLDLVDLRFASVYLQDEILQHGRCVYARSQAEQEAFERGKRTHIREGKGRDPANGSSSNRRQTHYPEPMDGNPRTKRSRT